MNRRIVGGLCALGMASALAGATAAGADPKNGEIIPVVCDNGHSYQVAVSGNGDFTPAHDTASTAMLIPVSFGTFSGTIRNAQGQVVDTFTEPGSEKGQSAKGLKDPVHCSFSFHFVSDGSDPEFPAGYTFDGSGTVVGRITPSN